MKFSRASIGEINTISIPDEVSYEIKKINDEKYELYIKQIYHCDKDTFERLEKNSEYTISSEYKDDLKYGIIIDQFKGKISEIVGFLFSLVLILAKTYLDDDKIIEIIETIKVFDVWEDEIYG
jgi:hypothetical protein